MAKLPPTEADLKGRKRKYREVIVKTTTQARACRSLILKADWKATVNPPRYADRTHPRWPFLDNDGKPERRAIMRMNTRLLPAEITGLCYEASGQWILAN